MGLVGHSPEVVLATVSQSCRKQDSIKRELKITLNLMSELGHDSFGLLKYVSHENKVWETLL